MLRLSGKTQWKNEGLLSCTLLKKNSETQKAGERIFQAEKTDELQQADEDVQKLSTEMGKRLCWAII